MKRQERGDHAAHQIARPSPSCMQSNLHHSTQHYHRDGAVRSDVPRYGENDNAYYEPNSFGGPEQDPTTKEPPLLLEGDVDRYAHRDGKDDYRQAGELFQLFDEDQRERLASNIATRDARRTGSDHRAPAGPLRTRG